MTSLDNNGNNAAAAGFGRLAEIKEPTIKRSRAAEILGGVCTRTLRRAEQAGLLTPIRRSSRATFYLLSEVEKLKRGNIARAEYGVPQQPPIRTNTGQFQKEVA